MKSLQRRKRLQSFDLSKQYECFLCFERLIDPVKCVECQKILCGSHILNLRNKCPNCRASPFKYKLDETLNIFLKCIKKQEWETLNKDAIYNCKIQNCEFTGNYVSMIKHRKRNHLERTIEEVMQGVNDVEENQKKIMKILKKLKAYKITIQTLSAVQNALFPDNPEEKKKQPSHVFAREMAKHINQCSSLDCKKMWNVKWGSYIGPESQQTNQDVFYFSQCPIGKQINQRLGWNYSDPLH